MFNEARMEVALGDLSVEETEKRQNKGDSLLKVKFFPKKVRMGFLSAEKGEDVFEERDYIEIKVPGQKLNVNIFQVTEVYKRRFPLQWEAYKLGKELGGDGTPISLMPGIGQAHLDTCKTINIDTMEQLLAVGLESLSPLGADVMPMRKIAEAYLKDNIKMVQADEPIDDNPKSSKKNGAVSKPNNGNRKRRSRNSKST